MKQLIALFCATLFLFCIVACDDNTGTLGNSITPSSDSITVKTATYYATSRSLKADSLLARAENIYLGRYTDPEANSIIEANFITQLNCVEGGEVFPSAEVIKGDTATRTELRLYFHSFYGDSVNAMQLEVYELENTLIEGSSYFTDIDIEDYIAADAQPIATKTWSAIDYGLENLNELDDEEYYHNICIPLPNDIGTRIIKAFRKNPEYFASATPFIENICKGFYVRCTQGDGTILKISQVSLGVCFELTSNDSIYNTQFSGSKEVLQVNHFEIKDIDKMVNNDECTYLMTPAGIFTEVSLPIHDIIAGEQDTINSVKVTLTRYNNNYTTAIHPSTPKTLLLVRKCDMYSFFYNNVLPNNQTSYLTTFSSSYNQYEYSNIARLIVTCRGERQKWIDQYADTHPDCQEEEALEAFANANPDWDKVVLIPVTTTTDGNSNIISVRHCFDIATTRLKGGAKNPIEIKIITSRFRQ